MKRFFKHTGIIIMSIILLSCNNKSIHNKLANDSTIKKVFTKSEIRDLNKIVEFVDSIVISQSPNVSIDSAYHFFLDSLRIRLTTERYFRAALDQELKYKFIFSLNHELVRNIWNTDSIARHLKYKDTVLLNLTDYPRLDLKSQGKYMDYIKIIGENDLAFKELYNDVRMCGHLSNSLRIGYIRRHNMLNFEILENRFWIAIFILTLEERTDKKIERYLKKKGVAYNNRHIL